MKAKTSGDLDRSIEKLRSDALLSLLNNETDLDRFKRAVEAAFGLEANEVIETNRRSGFYPPLRRPAEGSDLAILWTQMLRDQALAHLESEDPLIFCLELSKRMAR